MENHQDGTERLVAPAFILEATIYDYDLVCTSVPFAHQPGAYDWHDDLALLLCTPGIHIPLFGGKVVPDDNCQSDQLKVADKAVKIPRKPITQKSLFQEPAGVQ